MCVLIRILKRKPLLCLSEDNSYRPLPLFCKEISLVHYDGNRCWLTLPNPKRSARACFFAASVSFVFVPKRSARFCFFSLSKSSEMIPNLSARRFKVSASTPYKIRVSVYQCRSNRFPSYRCDFLSLLLLLLLLLLWLFGR